MRILIDGMTKQLPLYTLSDLADMDSWITEHVSGRNGSECGEAARETLQGPFKGLARTL